MGEVVGVFGKLKIDPAPWWMFWKWKNSYTSTIQFKNLGLLEKWLVELRSPRWVENYLPSIDIDLAVEGKRLFTENKRCSGCHQIIDPKDEGNKYKAKMIPIKKIKTDSTMAWNIDNHMAKTYILEGKKKHVIVGKPFDKETEEINIALNGVFGLILEHPIKSFEAGVKSLNKEDLESHLKSLELEGPEKIEDLIKMIGLKEAKKIEILKASIKEHLKRSKKTDSTLKYKARPLNGIWATAPYLHNGSVPNLWEILKTPSERVKYFYVGNRNFDTKNVGFETTEVSGSTTLFQVELVENDLIVLIPGNSNWGHNYGTNLTDDEKWALIEFMKTL